MNTISMLIGGARVAATFERRNPLDGQVATRAPAATPADAARAVEAAGQGVFRLVRYGAGRAPDLPLRVRPPRGQGNLGAVRRFLERREPRGLEGSIKRRGGFEIEATARIAG